MMLAKQPSWWMNPAPFLFFITMPLFFVSAVFGGQSLYQNRIYANYIEADAIYAGLAALLALGFGAALPVFFGRKPEPQTVSLPLARAVVALRVIAALVLLSEMIIFSSVFPSKTGLVIAAINGERAASNELFHSIGRIPGVTSFIQLKCLYFSLLAACALDHKFRMTKEIISLSLIVVVFTIAYSFLASERIAIIELAIAASFAPVAFRMRASFLRAAAPLIGILGVFVLFALGEYFRSWSFFRGTGIGFLEFAVTRFAGYFASSINNGAGIFNHLDHPHIPYFSAIWYYKFPVWGLIGFDVGQSPLEALTTYLARFGSLEFNNYSGVYAPLQDFGLGLGCFVMFVYGIIGGALYRNFANKGLFGLLLHPIWVIGYFDIIRIFYWGEPRFIPNLISALVLWVFLRNGGHRGLPMRSSL